MSCWFCGCFVLCRRRPAHTPNRTRPLHGVSALFLDCCYLSLPLFSRFLRLADVFCPSLVCALSPVRVRRVVLPSTAIGLTFCISKFFCRALPFSPDASPLSPLFSFPTFSLRCLVLFPHFPFRSLPCSVPYPSCKFVFFGFLCFESIQISKIAQASINGLLVPLLFFIAVDTPPCHVVLRRNGCKLTLLSLLLRLFFCPVICFVFLLVRGICIAFCCFPVFRKCSQLPCTAHPLSQVLHLYTGSACYRSFLHL